MFVLETKAGTSLSRAGQLSFDELRRSREVWSGQGRRPFVGRVINHSANLGGKNAGGRQQRTVADNRYGRNEAHRKPSQVGFIANFRRLCDLRSREVCLYRAPEFRGIDRC